MCLVTSNVKQFCTVDLVVERKTKPPFDGFESNKLDLIHLLKKERKCHAIHNLAVIMPGISNLESTVISSSISLTIVSDSLVKIKRKKKENSQVFLYKDHSRNT